MIPRITVKRLTGPAQLLVTGGLVIQLLAVPIPAPSQGATVRPVTIAPTSIVPAPAVLVNQAVAVSAIASTAGVSAPTVLTGAVTVAPFAIASGTAVFAPSLGVTGTQAVAPAAITSAAIVRTPAIVVGGVLIAPAAIPATSQVPMPTVGVAGAITVAPGSIASGASVASPVLSTGAVSVTPAALTSSATVASPTVIAGSVIVAPNVIASTAQVSAPAVQVITAGAISPAAIASGTILPAPTVLPGAVTLAPAVIAASSQAFAPLVSIGGAVIIAPGPIAPGASVASPVVSVAGTTMPTGMKVWFDPASTSAAGNGGAVNTWTDKLAGVVAPSTGTGSTYIANSGGLPAVRMAGADVFATSGANLANTIMTGAERTMIVVARAILDKPGGSSNPVLASSGSSTDLLFEADTTGTGFYGRFRDCADAGMRSIAFSSSNNLQFAWEGINGTAIHSASYLNGGQLAIGGWQNAGSGNTGRADILGVLIWDRALTAAELQQVHRYYCEKLSQARPGGGTAKTYVATGDSLTEGQGVTVAQSYPFLIKNALSLPWGTWHQAGVGGFTASDVRTRTLPMLGNCSAATGNRTVATFFEFVNQRQDSTATTQSRNVIDALHTLDANLDVVFGTSTDDGSTIGQSTQTARATYNSFWNTAGNRSGIATYVQTHLDPNIGVSGAAPTGGSASTYYQSDGIHLTAAGTALLDNGPHGFRSAVQALLA